MRAYINKYLKIWFLFTGLHIIRLRSEPFIYGKEVKLIRTQYPIVSVFTVYTCLSKTKTKNELLHRGSVSRTLLCFGSLFGP